jgi:hypothetical protein
MSFKESLLLFTQCSNIGRREVTAFYQPHYRRRKLQLEAFYVLSFCDQPDDGYRH